MGIVLNPGPLVCTIFVIFLYVLKSTLLVFLCLTLLHLQEFNLKVVNLFKYFCARFEVLNFYSKLQYQFYIVLLYSLPLCLKALLFSLKYAHVRSCG